MQEINTPHTIHIDEGPETPLPRITRRRLAYVAIVVLAITVLLLLPPLINLGRYQRRIATSISQSLGRPVHLDNVTLNLLPWPGLTLSNLVVDEDPAFGSEPVIRANTVTATLRLSSLWRRRFEFSTISFTEPSVNIVHTSEGKWNLQSILLRASQIDTAPTVQKKAGPAPRFPYIEATGARVNLKLEQEKTPVSLTDADFALWLPDPQQWHLRIKAHPTRTDIDASDTGTLQIEGTLGRASSLGQVPLNLTGAWHNAPLGEVSRLFLGRDAGIRGELALTGSVQGTVSQSALQLHLHLIGARRADFVPDHPLNVDMQCLGTASSFFHAFRDVRCSWPPAGSSTFASFGSSTAPVLAITADIPDVRRRDLSTIQIGTPGLPGSTLLDWLRLASDRIPADASLAGTLTGSVAYGHPASPPEALLKEPSAEQWNGRLLFTGTSLMSTHLAPSPLITGEMVLHTPDQTPAPQHRGRLVLASANTTSTTSGFILAPVSLNLGGKEPATVEGHVDATGYTLHLTGMATSARIEALAATLPPFFDGLAAIQPANVIAGAYRIDMTSVRTWGSPQVWIDNPIRSQAAPTHHRSR